MKLFYEYLLFFYLNIIKEDFGVIKKWALIFIVPAWFLRSLLMWCLFPFGFPFFVFYKKNESHIKKNIKEFKSVQEAVMSDFYKIINR